MSTSPEFLQIGLRTNSSAYREATVANMDTSIRCTARVGAQCEVRLTHRDDSKWLEEGWSSAIETEEETGHSHRVTEGEEQWPAPFDLGKLVDMNAQVGENDSTIGDGHHIATILKCLAVFGSKRNHTRTENLPQQ